MEAHKRFHHGKVVVVRGALLYLRKWKASGTTMNTLGRLHEDVGMELLGTLTKRNVGGGANRDMCCPGNSHGHERALTKKFPFSLSTTKMTLKSFLSTKRLFSAWKRFFLYRYLYYLLFSFRTVLNLSDVPFLTLELWYRTVA